MLTPRLGAPMTPGLEESCDLLSSALNLLVGAAKSSLCSGTLPKGQELECILPRLFLQGSGIISLTHYFQNTLAENSLFSLLTFFLVFLLIL